ncbi:MAG: alpha-E domain-containing protein [Gammaproteobacteria bacterium]|nr:alpha-E domain-containing protein [Gammaproteobacteria bacterium]
MNRDLGDVPRITVTNEIIITDPDNPRTLHFCLEEILGNEKCMKAVSFIQICLAFLQVLIVILPSRTLQGTLVVLILKLKFVPVAVNKFA